MNKKQDEAHVFLQEHKIAVVSTISREGNPWGAAVYFVTADDLTIYFLTRKGSKKYEDLSVNPKTAITVVDDYSQTTLQAAGTVNEVGLGDEHDMAFRKLAHVHPPGQFAWVPPVSKLQNGETALLKFTPDFMQLSQFRTPNGAPSIAVVIGEN